MVLATSAAWVAFSRVGVTDLPMAALFSAAMLLGLRWLSTGERGLLAAAAFFLALAVLAKGLVPLALSLPLFWAGRKRLKDWRHLLPIAIFFATAAPWYILCTLRNGPVFLAEFFGRHHFDRFSSGIGLHGQPFWYYLPVLVAGLFPWSPTLFALIRKGLYSHPGRQFLMLWLVFGFVLFSASAGKLPGYLLPLYPALAGLRGRGSRSDEECALGSGRQRSRVDVDSCHRNHPAGRARRWSAAHWRLQAAGTFASRSPVRH